MLLAPIIFELLREMLSFSFFETGFHAFSFMIYDDMQLVRSAQLALCMVQDLLILRLRSASFDGKSA